MSIFQFLTGILKGVHKGVTYSCQTHVAFLLVLIIIFPPPKKKTSFLPISCQSQKTVLGKQKVAKPQRRTVEQAAPRHTLKVHTAPASALTDTPHALFGICEASYTQSETNLGVLQLLEESERQPCRLQNKLLAGTSSTLNFWRLRRGGGRSKATPASTLPTSSRALFREQV